MVEVETEVIREQGVPRSINPYCPKSLRASCALDLAMVAIGAFYDDQVKDTISMLGEEIPFYVTPVEGRLRLVITTSAFRPRLNQLA